MRFGWDLGLRFERSRMGRFVRNFLVSFHRLRLQDPPANPAPRRAEDLHEPPQRCWAVGLRHAALAAEAPGLALQRDRLPARLRRRQRCGRSYALDHVQRRASGESGVNIVFTHFFHLISLPASDNSNEIRCIFHAIWAVLLAISNRNLGRSQRFSGLRQVKANAYPRPADEKTHLQPVPSDEL